MLDITTNEINREDYNENQNDVGEFGIMALANRHTHNGIDSPLLDVYYKGDIDSFDDDGNLITDVINARLDTQSEEILGEFTFGASGAIKMITDINNGLWISPTGILGKKAGATTFAIDTSGNATYAGDLTAAQITTGSISVLYTDADVTGDNQGDINTSNIVNDEGWTEGANWSTNLSNIPGTLAAPSGAGLYLGASNLGYYDSSNWKTYMDSSGNFYLGGTSGKFQWTAGTDTLDIQTNTAANTGVKIDDGGISVYGQTLDFLDSTGVSYGYLRADSASGNMQLTAHADTLPYGTLDFIAVGTSGTINLCIAGTTPNFKVDNTNNVSYSNLIPSADGTFYLGNSSFGWERLYLGTDGRYLDNNSGTLEWNGSPVGGSGTVTSVATSGAILGGTFTTSGTISHSTSAGYKHVPTSGASQKYLKYSSSGTAVWSYLGATANAASIVPGSGTTNLGSSTYYWDNIYGGKLNLKATTTNVSTAGDIINYANGGLDQFRGIPGDGSWDGSFDMTEIV